MKSSTPMSPQKRERYAQWLRDTGIDHPSDELIDKTRERALLSIDDTTKKAHRSKLKLVAFICCCLALALCGWLRL
jgi:hypothetical protein